MTNSLDEQIAAAQKALNSLNVDGGPPVQENQPWSPALVLGLAAMLLLFTLAVMYMMFTLMKRDKPPEGVLRNFGTPLIVVLAVLLVVIGFGEQQIAPVMGLLGTVAGYLLGRNTQGVATLTNSSTPKQGLVPTLAEQEPDERATEVPPT